MNKLKVFKYIDWGFMQFTTLLVIGYSKEECLKKIKSGKWRKVVESLDSNTYGEQENIEGRSVIWIREFDIQEWLDWDVLVHETSHDVFDNVTKIYPDNTELIAYAHENIFRLCRKAIFEQDAKIRKKTVKKEKKKVSHSRKKRI